MVNLKEVIDAVLLRMKRHRSLYEQNEMAIRDQIVNPVLRALGWDPENPEAVQPNTSTEEGIPDYSLIKNGKKVLFVEVKKLSIDIEQKGVINQLAKYCFGEGLKFGILTNGAIWMLFRSFEEGTKISERTVWKTDIESDEITTINRRFGTITNDNINNIENLVRKLRIQDEVWQSIVDEPEGMVKGLISVFQKLINEGYPDQQFEPAEIEDFLEEKIRELIAPSESVAPLPELPVGEVAHPRKMRIGNDEYQIKNSYEILVNTAEWLIGKGKLKKSDCPLFTGRTRNLVNTEPKHRYGEDFRAPKKLSNGIYIETHHSTAGSIRGARILLEKFGYSGDLLKVG